MEKLNAHLVEVDQQTQEMYNGLMNQIAVVCQYYRAFMDYRPNGLRREDAYYQRPSPRNHSCWINSCVTMIKAQVEKHCASTARLRAKS